MPWGPLLRMLMRNPRLTFQMAEQQSKKSAAKTSKIRQNELWRYIVSFPLEQLSPNLLLTFFMKWDYAGSCYSVISDNLKYQINLF